MANHAGVSGPFNPTIGLNQAQDGTAAPICVIGAPYGGTMAAWITAVQTASNSAALGNFFGQQSANTVSYKDGAHEMTRLVQPPGGPYGDFDATFTAQAAVAGAQAAVKYAQTAAVASPDQYKFS